MPFDAKAELKPSACTYFLGIEMSGRKTHLSVYRATNKKKEQIGEPNVSMGVILEL